MKFFGATKPGFNQASIHASGLHGELERTRYNLRAAYKADPKGRLGGCFGARLVANTDDTEACFGRKIRRKIRRKIKRIPMRGLIVELLFL
jgi:hypothetical protein